MLMPYSAMLISKVRSTEKIGLPESLALMVNEKLPGAVGLPVSAPVELFRTRPAGSVLPVFSANL